MTHMTKYNSWVTNKYFDVETRNELEKIVNDPNEIKERFYKDLEFGTGGLRGILGAGTNRMNIYTVRKATQGLCNYILKQNNKSLKSIVIAYDSRHKSSEFSFEAAKVCAYNGIKAYVFDELRPTPELSFAVRELHADAGIVITASHNPKEYNGYKVYGSDGAQLAIEASNLIIEEVNKIIDISSIKVMEKSDAIKNGLIEIIGNDIDTIYINKIKSLSINNDIIKKLSNPLKIVYTPIHGSGNKLVRRIMSEIGVREVLVVKEQELPDPEFSTVKSPNPEEKEALSLAIELAKLNNADLIIGTDPDCDRVGVVVKNPKNDYVVLTGNQIGCLLMEYILSQKKEKNELPQNGFVVKTIVTTELARMIAKYYNVMMIEVLTGFKFIGEKIKELDEFGDKKFLFGFEESYGYLAGTFSRDKDGVVTSMLISEMAAFYKNRGMSLYDGLIELYNKYGYTIESVKSYTLMGIDGIEKIQNTMNSLRNKKHKSINKINIVAIRDYLSKKRYFLSDNGINELSLPKSDVLYYEVDESTWFCIRPSGTEPKIKVYFGITAKSEDLANEKMNILRDNILSFVEDLLFR